MKNILERLQKQPREVKSHAAFLGALVITSLVGLIWVTTLGARFETNRSGETVSAVKDNMAALAEAVKSEMPTPEESSEEQSEDIRSRVDALMGSVKGSETTSEVSSTTSASTTSLITEGAGGRETSSTSQSGNSGEPKMDQSAPPSKPLPIRIEVVPRASGTPSSGTAQ